MQTTLGERIALARGRARVSQQELADAVGVSSHSQVSNWENNKRIPSGDVLMLLPEALGVDGHWLLTGQDPQGTDETLRIAAALRILHGDVDDLTLSVVARPADEAGALALAQQTLRIAGAHARPRLDEDDTTKPSRGTPSPRLHKTAGSKRGRKS